MSILNQLAGMAAQMMGGGQAQSPIAAILAQILGGQAPGMAAQPQANPLAALLAQFQQAGLGDQAQSWIGTGPNKPVPPNQLKDVFGEGTVNQWACQAGMDPSALLAQLSQMLPQAVDQMTPQGQIPETNMLRQMLAGFLGAGGNVSGKP
jgi:uncharacterized protein YidB (DUF937 family)